MSFDRSAAKDAAARYHHTNAAVLLGRKGGSVKSERKTAAARANAKRPRPRKPWMMLESQPDPKR
jgi:hypothetical protein